MKSPLTEIVTKFNEPIHNMIEFYENKKFEWEDEDRPEQDYNITYDINEWLSYTLYWSNCYYKSRLEDYNLLKNKENVSVTEPIPPATEEEILEYMTPLKEYIDGYMLGSTAIFKGQVLMTTSKRFETQNDALEFVKDVKIDNKNLFLHDIDFGTSYMPHCPRIVYVVV